MSADGSITLQWASGEHRFRLAIGELRELFDFVNKPRVAIGAGLIGPIDLLRSLQSGNAWPHEIREVMRLGLIGGGMSPLEALTLVKRYVEHRPALENMLPAYQVIEAACVGVPDDPVGKATAERDEATASPSPPSMDSAVH
jgi:hypothetical protein